MNQNIKHPPESFIQFLDKKKTPLQMNFLSAGLCNADLPPSVVPEIALVGRSNVGKSSLINFISGQKQLARVSNTPGRTQTINLFNVEKGEFLFVDLPGYGYAESAKSTKAHWHSAIQEFFEQRTGLFAVLFLVDMRRELKDEDEALSRWFQAIGIKVIGLQTKCDKLNKNEWVKARREQALKLALSPDQMITTSADKKIGLEEIFKTIAGLFLTDL